LGCVLEYLQSGAKLRTQRWAQPIKGGKSCNGDGYPVGPPLYIVYVDRTGVVKIAGVQHRRRQAAGDLGCAHRQGLCRIPPLPILLMFTRRVGSSPKRIWGHAYCNLTYIRTTFKEELVQLDWVHYIYACANHTMQFFFFGVLYHRALTRYSDQARDRGFIGLLV